MNAIDRVTEFVRQYDLRKPFRDYNPDVITVFYDPNTEPATLTIGDLRALLQMAQQEAAVTVLQSAEEIRDYLLAAGVVGPSLHPNVDGHDGWGNGGRWNGWNFTHAHGTDAAGRVVEVTAHHYAAGWVAYSSKVTGTQGLLQSDVPAMRGVTYPVTLQPALADILHPQWTPGTEEAHEREQERAVEEHEKTLADRVDDEIYGEGEEGE